MNEPSTEHKQTDEELGARALSLINTIFGAMGFHFSLNIVSHSKTRKKEIIDYNIYELDIYPDIRVLDGRLMKMTFFSVLLSAVLIMNDAVGVKNNVRQLNAIRMFACLKDKRKS